MSSMVKSMVTHRNPTASASPAVIARCVVHRTRPAPLTRLGYSSGDSPKEEIRHAVLRTRPRPHPLPGSRLWVPAAADSRWWAQLGAVVLGDRVALQADGAVQERLPVHLRGPAQRQPRVVDRP